MQNGLTVGRLIGREIQHAKLNTLLCLVTVVIATALLVAMVAISRASVDATRVMMKEMGFNLLIVPAGADPARYQALDFQDTDMPEEYVQQLAARGTIPAQHFVAKYQKTIQVDGCTVVLTGVRAELVRQGTQKKPMSTAYDVPQGKVFLGSAAAQALDKAAGDTLTVLGKPLEVGQVLAEAGIMPDDIRLYAHLHDVQEMLDRPGRINAIDALACYCPVQVDDVLGVLEKSVEDVLPDVNVQPYKSILLARHQQRTMVARLEFAALAIVLAGSAAAIWALTYQNVRSRRHEIGVLTALGIAEWRIGALFVGKIVAYSAVGAAMGCLAGYGLAVAFNVTGRAVSPPWAVILGALVCTPVLAVLFGLPPIVSRLMQEPIDVLGEAE